MSYRRVSWEQAAPYLTEKSLDLDGEQIAEMVERGEAAAWHVGKAALVGRFDGREFVLMCLEGQTCRDALRDFFRAVKSAGCESIRIHVKTAAVARLANIAMRDLCKFEPYELVYRATL